MTKRWNFTGQRKKFFDKWIKFDSDTRRRLHPKCEERYLAASFLYYRFLWEWKKSRKNYFIVHILNLNLYLRKFLTWPQGASRRATLWERLNSWSSSSSILSGRADLVCYQIEPILYHIFSVRRVARKIWNRHVFVPRILCAAHK